MRGVSTIAHIYYRLHRTWSLSTAILGLSKTLTLVLSPKPQEATTSKMCLEKTCIAASIGNIWTLLVAREAENEEIKESKA